MAARNFTNTASGASLNASLASGATSAALINFSGFPPAPFTATIGRNQTDEEIVLVTAVAGSTVTLTRGYDGTAAQAHNAGAAFELTAVAKDFNESQVHVNATGAVHGLSGSIVGDTDAQTLRNKTVYYLKGVATNAAAAFEADNDTGATGKLFRGLAAGVEKWFVDSTGNMTGQGVTGTTGTFSGALAAGAATLASLSVTGNGTVGGNLNVTGAVAAAGALSGTTVTGTGLVKGNALESATDVVLDQQSSSPASVASKTTLRAKTDGGIYGIGATGGVYRLPAFWGTGTAYPSAGVIDGDLFRHTGLGCVMRLENATWRQAAVAFAADAAARTAISSTYSSSLYADFRVYQIDTKVEWVWDGAAWQFSAGLGPLPTLVTLNSAWQNYQAKFPGTPPYENLQVSVVGTEVRLRGLITTVTATFGAGASTNMVDAGGIPAALRPAALCVRRAGVSGGNVTTRIDVLPSGAVAIGPLAGGVSVGGSDYIHIDVSWSLNNNV